MPKGCSRKGCWLQLVPYRRRRSARSRRAHRIKICRPSNQSVALRQSSTAEQKEELGTSQPELGIGGERPLVEDARDGAAASLRRSSPDLVLARRPWAQPPRQGDAPPVGRRARPPARTASLPSLAPACLPAASSGRWIKGRQSDTGIAA